MCPRPSRWPAAPRFRPLGLALALGALGAGCGTAPAARPALLPDAAALRAGDRDVDLVHVDLELTIDVDERSVAGVVRHTVRALLGDTRAMRVHARGLAIERVTAADGRTLDHAVAGEVVTVRFAEPLARAAEATVAIHYHGRPDGGLHFRGAAAGAEDPQVFSHGQPSGTRGWIPVWDEPNDRASFEGRFTVGHGLTALSNGQLLSVEPAEGDVRTFHWRFERTLPTYLIAVAVGRFECHAEEVEGVRLESWVPRGTAPARVARAFGETARMLAFFAERLDEPFPYRRYAQVAVRDFVAAGMENATLTIVDDVLLRDEAADLAGDPRLLVAHELAHQWFGDLVTCLGWQHLWLNEAWASFLELEYQGHVAGAASRALWFERYREVYLARGEAALHPLARSWRRRATERLAHHAYDKGPWVLRMIRAAIGDEAFWAGARLYLDRHADGFVTTADLQRAFFDASGRDVEELFEQWVHSPGHPHFRVRFSERAARAGDGPLALEVRQLQATDGGVPLFRVPVDVDVVGPHGRRRHRIEVARARETFELELDGPVTDVVFDAGGRLLCRLDVEKPADMWARQALDPTDPAGRWRALRGLDPRAGGSAGRIARATLLSVARADPEPLLRERAAAACRFTGAAATLVDLLERDPAAPVRRAAAEALAAFEPDRALRGRLAELARRERSPAVRAQLTRLAGAAGLP